MYYTGEGVPQDRQRGLELIVKSAEKNYPPAQLKLGMIYMTGDGVKMDQVLGQAWLDKAVVSRAAKSQPEPAATQIDVTLWCDLPTVAREPIRSLISIDTKSKYVKVEMPRQGTLEYRDGVFGKVATSGYISEQAISVQQFVEVKGESVRFGFNNRKVKQESTIDLRTGTMRADGQPTQCTVTPSR